MEHKFTRDSHESDRKHEAMIVSFSGLGEQHGNLFLVCAFAGSRVVMDVL